MAAKVAVLAFGTDSPRSEVYEKDATYYRIFPSSALRLAEYAEFKKLLAQFAKEQP
jgi:hypothetical protein